MNVNDSNRLIYSNTWYPFGGTAWEGLEGVALLEKVCHGGALRFQMTPASESLSAMWFCLKM